MSELSKPSHEIPEITGMRGWAALSVVLFHVCTVSPPITAFLLSRFPFPLGLRVGVDFFFVLSGFLLSRQFLDSKVSLGHYYLRRVFRIWPLYYSGLLASILLWLMIGVRFTSFQILANLTFAQNYFAATYLQQINGPYWTLGIEEAFYLLLPAMVFLLTWKHWRVVLVELVLIAIFYRLTVGIYGSFFLSENILGYLSNFVVGIMLARGSFRVKPTWFNIAITFGSLAGVISLIGVDLNYYLFPVVPPLLAVVFGSLLSLTIGSRPGSLVKRLYTNRLAMAAGRVSYSTYIWHWILLVILYKVTPFWLPIFLTLLPVISYLSWRWIELPFDALRHRVFPLGR